MENDCDNLPEQNCEKNDGDCSENVHEEGALKPHYDTKKLACCGESSSKPCYELTLVALAMKSVVDFIRIRSPEDELSAKPQGRIVKSPD